MADDAIGPGSETDLVLTRVIDLPPETVWRAWTEPRHLETWFTPAPWTVAACEIDLRPGGLFRTVMRSPDGQEFPNDGCYLEVLPNRRLVFTDAVLPGFRPSGKPFMTGVIELEPVGSRTRYTATAMHADAATRQRHEEMGFHAGWGKALDQLIEHAKTM